MQDNVEEKEIPEAHLSITNSSSGRIWIWKETYVQKPFGFSQNSIGTWNQVQCNTSQNKSRICTCARERERERERERDGDRGINGKLVQNSIKRQGVGLGRKNIYFIMKQKKDQRWAIKQNKHTCLFPFFLEVGTDITEKNDAYQLRTCLLYTSPSPRD